MINQVIEKYRIIRLIGQGGMARVYEAVHIHLGKRVAIKVLNEELIRKTSIRKRFENEAKIMADLEHPNIVKILDYIERDNLLAIVMELLQGQTLTDYIKRKGGLNKQEIVKIFLQVLDAFNLAHRKGIIHRDIKPSNIYLETHRNNNVKILDFGIAKLISSDLSMTSTGTQMGSPLYMSPEQVKDSSHITHLSDIYSLGVVLYHMVSGKPPYDTTTLSRFDIFNKIVYEPLPPLNRYSEFNSVIQKATQKDSSKRYRSCAEFAQDIKKIAHSAPVNQAATQIMPPERSFQSRTASRQTSRKTYRHHTPPPVNKPPVTRRRYYTYPEKESGKGWVVAAVIFLMFLVGGGAYIYIYHPEFFGKKTNGEHEETTYTESTVQIQPTEETPPPPPPPPVKHTPFMLVFPEGAVPADIMEIKENYIAAGYKNSSGTLYSWTQEISSDGQQMQPWISLHHPQSRVLFVKRIPSKNEFVLLEENKPRKQYTIYKITNNRLDEGKTLPFSTKIKLTSMTVNNEGIVFLAGYEKKPRLREEAMLFQISPSFISLHKKDLPGSKRKDIINKVIVTDNGYYLAGEKASKPWLVKLNRNLDIEWEKTYDFGKNIKDMVWKEDNLYLTGEKRSADKSDINIYSMAVDPNGLPKWNAPHEMGTVENTERNPRIIFQDNRFLIGATQDIITPGSEPQQNIVFYFTDTHGNMLGGDTKKIKGELTGMIPTSDQGVLVGFKRQSGNRTEGGLSKWYPRAGESLSMR